MVLGCWDPYFIVLDGRDPCCFNNGMNGVACRHEMVAREGVVTDHVRSISTSVETFPPR